ncbi:DNA-directed DNA polymerase [Blastocladiella emersonii ATCC 22665]|nr:DNA-directed DNA polymerase [Blastocladiella emersonii ATCC 22665]
MAPLARNLPPQPVLQHFWDLASVDEKARVAAAHKLLVHLAPLHQAHAAAAPATAALDAALAAPVPADAAARKAHNAALLAAVQDVLHPHVAYAFTRLVKGVPSGREAARQGFTLALTWLVRLAFPTLRWAVLHAAMHKYILDAPSDSTADERDKLFGRMLVVTAALESGLAAHESTTAADAVEMATALVAVIEAKQYLREAGLVLLFRLIEACPAHRAAIAETAAAALLPATAAEFTSLHQLTLSAYLEHFKMATPLPVSAEAFSAGPITDLLLDATSVAPRLHTVWSVLIARILGVPAARVEITLPSFETDDEDETATALPSRRSAATVDAALLAAFWHAVDRTMLVSLPQRQAAALHLFAYLFAAVPVALLPTLFSTNLVRLLDAATASRRHALRPHVRRAMRVVHAACLADPAAIPTVLASVKPAVFRTARKAAEAAAPKKTDGDASSDEEDESSDDDAESPATATVDPLETLLAALTEADLAAYVDTLLDRAVTAATSAEADASTAPLDALVHGSLVTVTGASATAGSDLRTRIASFLLGPVHGATRDSARRVQEFLARAVPAPETHVESLAAIYRAFPDADARVLAWVESPATAGEAVMQKKENAIRALVMAAHLVVGMDARAAEGDAATPAVVDELVSVWRRYAEGNQGGDDELHPLDVLADTMLELTAHPMAWLRRLCNQVFGQFADAMTDNTLDLLVSVLAGETGADDEEMDEDEEEEVEEEAESSDDDDEEEDSMEVDGAAAASDDDDEDDMDEDAADESAAERQRQLSAAITQALQSSGMAQTGDEESDLDDDAMLALDNVLGALVRKQNTRLQATERLHFQYRVADLVAVYLKHRAATPVAHLRALADRIGQTNDKQLATKLWHAVAQIKKVEAGDDVADGEIDALFALFLKGNLAQAHPVLTKMFKAFKLSPATAAILLADIKRYKSVLATLARTLPAVCGPILEAATKNLSRKNVKAVQTVIQPLLERVPAVPELKAAFAGAAPAAAAEKKPAASKKSKGSKKGASPTPTPAPESVASPSSTLAALMGKELADNPKDTALLKLTVAALRAAIKAQAPTDAWRAAAEGVATAPTKQAAAALFKEVKKLLGMPVEEPAAKPKKEKKAAAAAAKEEQEA